ncbi:hypothetical protein TCAL_06060 [Tigriopus californicus]|uniref:Uncharacterized protein n=1 Tax=Tigriopus californicus TaxID=6832 RepID=A0A553PQ41_TIGCA|nr:hypothetical protein TCAL_06060 [Tigriopus californicus]|eukprot:TCALIF_06060-PA protein Name:"Protein of unknown function" AED:0.02 eAED:0.02 QI:273/0.75/0.8/1/0.5/0.8/5/211/529
MIWNAWEDHTRRQKSDTAQRRLLISEDMPGSDPQDEVCGEQNPGFPLWTSAHGFHHWTLTRTQCWRVFWIVIVLCSTIALICCVAFYFYYAFTLNKISNVTTFGKDQASLLSWTLSPRLSLPSLVENDPIITTIRNGLDNTLAASKYNGSYERLIQDVAPRCRELILECQLGSRVLSGINCCSQYFDDKPTVNQYGTCYSTRGGLEKYVVDQAGEGNGFTIITQHEDAEAFDASLASSNIYGAKGVNFAVVDEHTSILTAMRTRAQSVQLGSFATIGISRNYVDNTDLEFSLIGRMECTEPGTRNSAVEQFLVGISSAYGYSKDNCQTSKDEILARELLNCTFNPLSPGPEQCSPIESATFQKSFLSSNGSSSSKLPAVSVTQGVKDKIDAVCPQDCIQDSYTISPSYSPISDSLKADIQKKIPPNGQNTNVIVLKFFLNSMEYQRIHNFPQHGMQFVAEVGGLMAFFLGISVISIIECLCYGLTCCWSACCGRCCSDDIEDDQAREDLPPPKWRSNKPKEQGTRESYY